jgi:hypothetical protein
MFLYPERARKNRILPKSKVYGYAHPSRATRQRFISEVDQIVWRYKLAPDTINLPAQPGIEEIQVFEIALRTGKLKEEILRTIDRAIPSLLFFELTYRGQIRFAAAYKRLSEAVAGQPVVETYFETPWQAATLPRQPLPIALNLSVLYELMLRQYMRASPIGLCARIGETLAETVERGNQIRAKRSECQKLETRLRREMQFNRKVEINAALRRSRAELATLERTSTPKGRVVKNPGTDA